MSASALKSTIPGVGTSPSSTSHSILPMNTMAQKVVSGSEPASMKPLPGTGLSYVTLQPPNHPSSQPLSLVQDHRPSVYQTPPYVSSNSEKEDLDKLIPNGVEIIKTETEQNISVSIKQNESNRNNNLSPDNPTQDSQREVQTDQEMTSINLDFPALCPQLQNKVEEKKTPVNNGSKESDGIPINTTSQTKLSSHKSEDGSVKSDSQKSKTITQNTKLIADSSALSQTSNPPKIETKVTGSPKANKRKSRELKDLKGISATSDGASKPKRNRIQTQPYQSPLPEIALLVKNLNKPPPSKASDDKLIVFYKNEFLAVRNAEGSFYVCQAMQNIYKSSRKIRIRWLSQDKNNGEIYSPDFYDYIDFDCILTNLNLNKIDKNKFQLTKIELLRTENILKRAIDVEAGVSEKPRVTEEHPDGLDLSLYKDESQLKRRKSHNLHKQKQSLRKKAKRTESFSVDIKLAEGGIAIKHQSGEILTIEKSNIRDIEMFRGSLGVNLRIYENIPYFINGIPDNFIDSIIKICNDAYKINLYMRELEITNVGRGDLTVNGKGFIEFSNEKTIFEIPIKDIDCIADIRNELSVKLDNVEIRFVTTKETINEIKDACNSNIEDDLVTFEAITMVYPRGKNNFMLYKDYFRIIGYSYDHKIYYKNVKDIFFLEKNYISDQDKYIALSLETPIRQGLTKYYLIVLSFGNEEVDVDINDSRLEKRYNGLLSDVFIDIFEHLVEVDAITSKFITSDKRRGLKCTYKAYEGQIYPLDGCLIFLPRSIKINIKDIFSVEFSRINVSSLQAKTFDMTISAETNYTFNGLYKEDFGILEKYFNENNVTIRSEVFDEVISSEESEGYASDDDFIASDEEY